MICIEADEKIVAAGSQIKYFIAAVTETGARKILDRNAYAVFFGFLS